MSNSSCNAVGCSNSTLKKNNVEKYPWLKDVKFRSFPHASREKNDNCRFERFDTNQTGSQTRFQTHENEKGPTSEHPIHTDFDYNHYKRPTKERSSKVAELRDAMRLTREIALVRANVDTARDVGNDFISDESYIQYYNSSLDSYIAEQTKINTDVYSGVRKRQVISLIINSNQSYH